MSIYILQMRTRTLQNTQQRPAFKWK